MSAAALATDAVLKNLVVFGSVNANRRHYYRAAKALAAPIVAGWSNWSPAGSARRGGVRVAAAPDDIKVIVEMTRS